MAEQLLKLMPKHSRYVEPFCGGAALLFAKEPVAEEILNDKEDKIVNFFKVLREQGEELQRVCMLTPNALTEYKRALDGKGNPVERARKWFVKTNLSFGNAPGSGYSRLQSWKMANKADLLMGCAQRLRGVNIENCGALETIKRYDSEDTLFYCDPPYPDADQNAYANKFNLQDFNELVDLLDKIKGSFLLSCYRVKGMQIPGDWEEFSISKKIYFGDKVQNRKEIVFRKLNRFSSDMFCGKEWIE